jgi:hypothetical protein
MKALGREVRELGKADEIFKAGDAKGSKWLSQTLTGPAKAATVSSRPTSWPVLGVSPLSS